MSKQDCSRRSGRGRALYPRTPAKGAKPETVEDSPDRGTPVSGRGFAVPAFINLKLIFIFNFYINLILLIKL